MLITNYIDCKTSSDWNHWNKFLTSFLKPLLPREALWSSNPLAFWNSIFPKTENHMNPLLAKYCIPHKVWGIEKRKELKDRSFNFSLKLTGFQNFWSTTPQFRFSMLHFYSNKNGLNSILYARTTTQDGQQLQEMFSLTSITHLLLLIPWLVLTSLTAHAAWFFSVSCCISPLFSTLCVPYFHRSLIANAFNSFIMATERLDDDAEQHCESGKAKVAVEKWDGNLRLLGRMVQFFAKYAVVPVSSLVSTM